MNRVSRHVRKRTGVAPRGAKADYHFRTESKYYEMIENSSNITVNYGRVDHTKTTISKPIHHWDKLIREKTAKGYKDVTHLVSVQVDKKTEEIKLDKIVGKVGSFLELMSNYTNNLVKTTYSVKATNVSQQQVDEAQKHIDDINNIIKGKYDDKQVNDLLVELYMVIPRKMDNVKWHLLPQIKIDKVIQQEQDNLDAMASQVSMNKPLKKSKVSKKTINLMDKLGITMKECAINKDIKYLTDQVSPSKILGVYEVNKGEEDKVFEEWMSKQKNKTTRILIHGTRCTSVIPILEIGLKIRPVGNFQFSGKVYGNGNYYSETVSKSLNYTGYDNDQILLVYEVHVGNPFVYDGWYRGNSFTLDYKNLSERGFDSTFVKAGGGLLNTEIIAYKEEQCRIKYIIHLKR
jgi:poly [ADP-ribose] polymerase